MIEIRLKKGLPTFTIEIDITVEEQMFVSLFGKSGAGKTTILRMLAGIETPDEGFIKSGKEVWYDSASKINLPPQQRKTGYVFQDYALFPNMTVLENLVYALPGTRESVAAKKEKTFVQEILQFTGLKDLQHYRPGVLSGGQKQRVALARAIVRRPSVLLLDEPFSSLDTELRFKLHEELTKIVNNFSLTTILVTHDYSDIFQLADRVFLINEGKIKRSGNPSDLFVSEKISNKFLFEAQVLQIDYDEVLYILTLLIGSNLVKIIASEDEVENLKPGDRIIVASKSFHPVIVGKIKRDKLFS